VRALPHPNPRLYITSLQDAHWSRLGSQHIYGRAPCIAVSNGDSIGSTLERAEITSTDTEQQLGTGRTSTFSIRAFASRTTTLGPVPPGDSRPDAAGQGAALATRQMVSSRAVLATTGMAPIAHRLRRGVRTALRRELRSSRCRCSVAQMAPARTRVSFKGWIRS
jgi:hypothetical protein